MPLAVRRDRDKPMLAFAGLILAWSLLPLGVLLVDVMRHGGVLVGADSMHAGSDQTLYMQQVRESGSDVLISNEYRLGSSTGVYLHPMFFLSGLLYALGVSVKVAFLLWKPIACVVLAVGVLAYVRRLVEGRAARAAAAFLAVFFFSPALPLLDWTGNDLDPLDNLFLLFSSGDPMAGLQTWGYLHTVTVIGLMALFLLAAERAIDPERRRPGRSQGWYLGWMTAAGVVAAWVHPWQGATLAAVLIGAAAWGRFDRRYRVFALPVAAIAVPIVYLGLLSKLDDDWVKFAEQNAGDQAPLWIVLLAFGPLVLPAIAGVRPRTTDVQERMMLLWAAAGLVGYFASPQFPSHALQGVSIPLAILAVRGWPRLRLPRPAAVAAVAVLTLPGTAFIVESFVSDRHSHEAPYRLADGEDDALRFIEESEREGGVLSRFYLGGAVPALTGRDTWVGHFAWTPDFDERRRRADELFDGRMPAAEATALVSGARPAFLLADCLVNRDLRPRLGALVERTHRFGCATVYELRTR